MGRFSKNSSLVPRTIEGENILVIGCGAIGKQVALSLAAMGAKHLELCDFDEVDESNISTQAFRVDDVGKNKAEVVAEMCKSMDFEGDANITPNPNQWSPNNVIMDPTVVFCCVDSILTRKVIFKWFQKLEGVNVFFDARMLGETMYVFAIKKDQESEDYYDKTLFDPEEAEEGRCTARSTISAATIAGNLCIHQFTRYLRGYDMDKSLGLNLLESDFHRYQV